MCAWGILLVHLSYRNYNLKTTLEEVCSGSTSQAVAHNCNQTLATVIGGLAHNVNIFFLQGWNPGQERLEEHIERRSKYPPVTQNTPWLIITTPGQFKCVYVAGK